MLGETRVRKRRQEERNLDFKYKLKKNILYKAMTKR